MATTSQGRLARWVVGGPPLAYLVVFSLANFVDLKPREIRVTVPPDKFLKR